VVVVPNGASKESLQEFSDAELEALQKQMGKKEGDVFLLSVGRLVHQKAIDVVLRALALLPQNIKLIVAGDGPDKAALVKLANELGIAARVAFVGQVDRTTTAKYRKACDIFVLPSRSEGQSISLVSAMLSGIPIVATQVGGIADFLFDAKKNPGKQPTGFAVDPDSPEQIAKTVEYMLANPAEVQTIVSNAKKLAEENYNWDTIAKVMQQKVFSKALAK
jgi:glycosyltransferase involved in cell wall biosynthesis